MEESFERREKRRSEKKRRRWVRYFIYLLCVVLGFLIATFSVAMAIPLPEAELPEASVVLDANEKVLGKFFVENRTWVPLKQIPQHLQDAVIAIEDNRFYQHKGLSPTSIARAIYNNIRKGRIVEGGSTITMQLAKNMFLRPEKTLRRKFLEVLITIKLETKYSKQEILEMYLNQIYLGHGAYGVEVASQTYFGKSVKDLTLDESALLAALIRLPEFYSPYKNPEAALERRKLVLNAMVRQGFITETQAEKAANKGLRLAGLKPLYPKESAYLLQYIRDVLTKRHPDMSESLDRAGYRIYTSVDSKMQLAAYEALTGGLPKAKANEKGILQPQGAIVALDPSTGFIKALVGGRDFSNSQFNRAVQAERQPGSAFKPYLYTAVVNAGYNPLAQKVCEPVQYPGWGGKVYAPHDYGSPPYHYRPMTIREAIRISDNVVAVRWMEQIGPSTAALIAQRMGAYDSPPEPTLALALGASKTSPLKMAVGYATLANMGYRVNPEVIVKVVDTKGNVIEENRPRLVKVLRPEVAYVVTDLLKSVFEPGGTGSGLAIGRPVAGKTGTTDNYRDAWFIGYTPDLVAAVWVGNDNDSVPVGGTGGRIAGPIWARFMRGALANVPPKDFAQPVGVVRVNVCTESGLLASPNCPSVSEVFVKGTEPSMMCPGTHGQSPEPTSPAEVTHSGEGDTIQPEKSDTIQPGQTPSQEVTVPPERPERPKNDREAGKKRNETRGPDTLPDRSKDRELGLPPSRPEQREKRLSIPPLEELLASLPVQP